MGPQAAPDAFAGRGRPRRKRRCPIPAPAPAGASRPRACAATQALLQASKRCVWPPLGEVMATRLPSPEYATKPAWPCIAIGAEHACLCNVQAPGILRRMRSVKKEIDEADALEAAVASVEAALLDYVEPCGLTPRTRDTLAELDRAGSCARTEQSR